MSLKYPFLNVASYLGIPVKMPLSPRHYVDENEQSGTFWELGFPTLYLKLEPTFFINITGTFKKSVGEGAYANLWDLRFRFVREKMLNDYQKDRAGFIESGVVGENITQEVVVSGFSQQAVQDIATAWNLGCSLEQFLEAIEKYSPELYPDFKDGLLRYDSLTTEADMREIQRAYNKRMTSKVIPSRQGPGDGSA